MKRRTRYWNFIWIMGSQQSCSPSVLRQLTRVSVASYGFRVTYTLSHTLDTAVDILRVGEFRLICHRSSPTHNSTSEFLQLTSSPSCCRNARHILPPPPSPLPPSLILPPGRPLLIHPLPIISLPASLRWKPCQRRLSHTESSASLSSSWQTPQKHEPSH